MLSDHAGVPAPAPTRTRSWPRRVALALGLLVALPTVALLIAGCVGGCVVRPPRPNSVSLDQRLDMLPAQNALPARGALAIHWSAQQVPFIEAADDADVPMAMGVVHAHLRLGQMEVLRHISQGRLGELAGPLPIVTDVDHTLRTIDFPKAADEIITRMRPDTRAWLERYVEGINAVIAHHRAQRNWPSDVRTFGLTPQAWTIRDVVAVGRLAGTDINWGAFFQYLSLQNQRGGRELWDRTRNYHDGASPSFGPPVGSPALDVFTGLLPGATKSGSNTFVVAPTRTARGHALLSNDPHVGFTLPALWCIVGYRSPSHQAVGLSIPGLPFVLLGRNDRIAWGGTNMQALSSTLYDASAIPPEQVTSRTVTLARRWWFPTTRTVRDTPVGPMISDTSFFSQSPVPLALRWRGHEASDEFSAFFDASRATSWSQFRAAFASFAVSGQNFLYADVDGNIGQLLALEHQPAVGRTARMPIANPANPDHQWSTPGIRSDQLPAAFNPPEGFLVSANNTPVRLDPPVSIGTNWNDRFHRLTALLQANPRVDVASAVAMQQDVFSEQSLVLARAIVARASAAGITHPLLGELASWDGRYAINSRGALVLQAIAQQLITLHYSRVASPAVAESLLDSSAAMTLLAQDVESGSADASLGPALVAAARAAPADKVWGDVHRVRRAHWIGLVPVLGSSYVQGDEPIPGSLTTVFKSAAPISAQRHFSRYGANARHVIDMSHPDEHFVALFGGNDGWPGSVNFLDQLDAWRSGELIRLPLSPEGVARATVRTTRWQPKP